MTTRQRYGVYTDNPKDLEARLLRIETELALRQPASLVDPGSNDRGAFSRNPPQVTGLLLVPNIGTISIKWNRVGINNLAYYEVQIDDNLAFSSSQSFKTTDTFFTYQEGSTATRYYVRVRAIITDGKNTAAGLWSTTLNSLPGSVGTVNISANAATVLAEEVITSVGAIPAYGTLSYGNLSITSTGGVVDIRSIIDYTGTIANTSGTNYPRITTELFRNPGSILIGTAYTDIPTNASTAQFTVSGFSPFDSPPAGTHTYSFTTTTTEIGSGSATINLTINTATIQAVEIRK